MKSFALTVVFLFLMGARVSGGGLSPSENAASLSPGTVSNSSAAYLFAQAPPAPAAPKKVNDSDGCGIAQNKFASLMREAKRLATTRKERQAFDEALKALLVIQPCPKSSASAKEAVIFLKTLLLSIRLDPMNTQQTGDLQAGLPKPLLVTVSRSPQKIPVEGWPLLFTMGDTGELLEGNVYSDPQGKAACQVRKFTTPGESLSLVAQSDGEILLAGLTENDPRRIELMEVIRQQSAYYTAKVSGIESNETSQIITSGQWSKVDLVKIQTALAGIGYTVRSDAIEKGPGWESQLAPNIQYLVLLDNEIQQENEMSGMYISVAQASIVVKNRAGATDSAPARTFVCQGKGGGANRYVATKAAFTNAADKIAKQVQAGLPLSQP